ncbi:MAG: hypothetical protein B7Z15_11055, partial [Rhizobiales bacterium 32-66-8]
MRIVAAGALLAGSQAAAAQSDGTLEDAYAAQCAQHPKTQLCIALRNAMESSAGISQAPQQTGAGAGTRAIKSKAKAAPSKAPPPPPPEPPRLVERILDVQGELIKGDKRKNGARYDSHRLVPRAGYVLRVRLYSDALLDATICAKEDSSGGCAL